MKKFCLLLFVLLFSGFALSQNECPSGTYAPTWGIVTGTDGLAHQTVCYQYTSGGSVTMILPKGGPTVNDGSLPSLANFDISFANALQSVPANVRSFISGSGSGGAAYPFLEAGNLLLFSRQAGATRDIIFYTGNPPVIRGMFDRAGPFKLPNSATVSWTAGTIESAQTAISNFSIPCTTSQKSESAADANVLTCTPPSVAGTYSLILNISVSAANTATLGWTATWKDSNGTSQAPTNLPICISSAGTCAATTGATSSTITASGDYSIDIDNSATNIVVKLTFSGTSFTAKVTAVIQRLI